MRRIHFAFAPLLFLVPACKGTTSEAAQSRRDAAVAPLKVTLAPVEKRPMPRYLLLTGSLLAERQSELAANVAGRVVATYVERGQAVKAGQTIAVVDAKAASLSASAAAAQQKVAETQMALAVADCQRADQLYEKGASTKAEYDRAKTQCAAQLSQADAARSNAALASKLAGDAVIRAPFDGVIGERYVNVGEYVQPQSKVASVYVVDPVRVSISVPEHAVGAVQRGQGIDLNVAAFEERTFHGTVRYVAPVLRARERDLVVEAVAANADGALKPGMFATVKLQVGSAEQPTVPVEALRVRDTVKKLFVARDKHAFELVVRTGETRDGRIAILPSSSTSSTSGDDLEPGAQVIVHPPETLRDGAAIE